MSDTKTDRWVNAVAEFRVPLNVPVDASPKEKLEAAMHCFGDYFMESFDGATVSWEDVLNGEPPESFCSCDTARKLQVQLENKKARRHHCETRIANQREEIRNLQTVTKKKNRTREAQLEKANERLMSGLARSKHRGQQAETRSVRLQQAIEKALSSNQIPDDVKADLEDALNRENGPSTPKPE